VDVNFDASGCLFASGKWGTIPLRILIFMDLCRDIAVIWNGKQCQYIYSLSFLSRAGKVSGIEKQKNLHCLVTYQFTIGTDRVLSE
jgi:hypothetical protein